jgi:tetratricopeptide (TPR) repeat protein
MKHPSRSVIYVAGFALAVVGLWAAATPLRAQSQEPSSGQEQAADAAGSKTDEQAADELSKRERKQAAKERRIQEYLRKREERRAEKEQNRTAHEASEREKTAQEIEKQQLAASGEIEAPRGKAALAPPPVEEPRERKRGTGGGSRLPRGLARAQANVRATDLGADPTVQEYLELIDEQGASPDQLAAFGNFVAQNGMLDDAMAYYDVAVKIEPRDPTLWVNKGTLQLHAGHFSAAASDFGRALSLDPNHAVAHYNLGSALDEMDRYEDAVQEYKVALLLDPSLGDPTYNPQSANNDLLLAVKLMLYQEQSGSLSVPLLDVETGKLPTAPEEEDEQR